MHNTEGTVRPLYNAYGDDGMHAVAEGTRELRTVSVRCHGSKSAVGHLASCARGTCGHRAPNDSGFYLESGYQ